MQNKSGKNQIHNEGEIESPIMMGNQVIIAYTIYIEKPGSV